jgi:acylphosphatase
MSDRPAAPAHRLAVRVHGRVQGVGFRWFVRERARRLGLDGTVRNVPDGSVAIEAGGSPTALAALRALLFEGPSGALVDRVEEVPPALDPLPAPFQILR